MARKPTTEAAPTTAQAAARIDAIVIAAAPELLAFAMAAEAADAAEDEAIEMTERVAAEGWEPTGSMHVTEAYDRAAELRRRATELREAALAKVEGRS